MSVNPHNLGPQAGGQLRAGVIAHDGKVIIDFGTQLRYVLATPSEARALAAVLIEKADEAERST